MQALSNATPPPKAAGKARLLTLGHLDGRTAAARRAHELIETIETDLGGGDRLSEGSRQLVQRAAVLGTFIESCEAQWLGGEAVDLADYLAAINSQRRVLATIGLERRARDVSPSLDDIAAEIEAEREEAAGA
jgi:glutathione S-transferase